MGEEFPATHGNSALDILGSPSLVDQDHMARLSGLQRDVIHLYRSCLRAARKKPEVHSPRSTKVCHHADTFNPIQATRDNFRRAAR
jgi:hypothetical protein